MEDDSSGNGGEGDASGRRVEGRQSELSRDSSVQRRVREGEGAGVDGGDEVRRNGEQSCIGSSHVEGNADRLHSNQRMLNIYSKTKDTLCLDKTEGKTVKETTPELLLNWKELGTKVSSGEVGVKVTPLSEGVR